MNKISAIIPTEGDLNWKNQSILYTIMSLKEQIDVEIEIIVVTSKADEHFKKKMMELDVGVVVTEHKYCGERRNFGASYSKNNILLFIDDDTVIVDRMAASKICSILDINDFTCGANRYWSSFYWYKHVSPLLSINSNLTILKNISILPRGINRAFGFRDLNEFTFMGNFGAIKKEVFQSAGKFGEDFPVYGYEDVDLMMRLCMKGYRSELLCERSIGVIHLTHPTQTEESLSKNGRTFDEIQQNRGYYFQANHFFGVYEGDGHAILTPCEQLHRMLGAD